MTTISNKPIRVFLCHASIDKLAVRKLNKKLIEDHIDVWFDEERLLPGQDWDIEIQKAVRLSDVVVICLSSKSVTKEGYVQKEIKMALDFADEKPDETIFIIPVRLDDCKVPDRIKRWQWLDIFSQISEIDNSNYNKLIKSLEIRALQLESRLRSVEESIIKFEPNNVMSNPYMSWAYPNPRKIFNNIILPDRDENHVQRLARDVQKSLSSLGVPVQVVEINYGPRFTRFGVEPLFKQVGINRVKISVSEIMSVVDDLNAMLGVRDIQIEPARRHSYVGIDIPNDEMVDVNLLDILDGEKYKNRKRPLTIALGCDVVSEPVLISLSLLPNILIGGMTNSGKSTCLANIISCLLVNNSPNELKILLMDMRRIEFSAFFDIPHLLAPVITDKDLAISAIDWLLQEVERRKVLFANQKFRNFEEYNAYVEIGRQLPFILVFIGELSDLITPTNNNVQSALAKIAGLARVTGVHLVVSSQRLTNDVITDVLKQNFTNRIVLKTSSQTDSTNILSHPGAEKLLGRGDMLFLETGKNAPTRVQGVLLSDDEIVRLIEFWKDQSI